MSGGIAWTSLITGLITATATLTGVWLTQRHARRMRLMDRHEECRAEQRDALAEVLATGREWAGMLLTMVQSATLYGDPPDVQVASQHRVLLETHLRAW